MQFFLQNVSLFLVFLHYNSRKQHLTWFFGLSLLLFPVLLHYHNIFITQKNSFFRQISMTKCSFSKLAYRSSHRGSAVRTWLVSMRMRIRSLALLSGLRIWYCQELWYRSQMWLRSCTAVAVAKAGSCSSNSTPSLGTSICCRCVSPDHPPKKNKITCLQVLTI